MLDPVQHSIVEASGELKFVILIERVPFDAVSSIVEERT
jgi:hypothetical protein